MARIYSVLQRESNKRFDMTVSSDEEGWAHAVGYCSGWGGDPDEAEKQRLTKLFGDDFVERLQADWQDKISFKDNFHRDGHATREEAYACYKKYELDIELKFRNSSTEMKKCQICEAWTTGSAEVGNSCSRYFILCPEHATREQVEILMERKR